MELKPGYKQSEVGLIPEDWDVQPLLKAVHIANGQVNPNHEPYKSMILVAPDHIESSTGKLLSKKTAAEQGAISGKYMFESGDILYSKIRPYLRKAILADFSGLCSADMYPLKPAPWASGDYILAIILGHRFTRYAESVSVRSGMPKINRAEMAEFAIAVPPLLEQIAIGSVLSDIDRLIRDLESLIAKKRNIKQAAMHELLTGKRRLPGFEGEWEVKRLGDHVKFLRNGVNSRAELQPEGRIRYLHYGDIHASSDSLLCPEQLANLTATKAAGLDRLQNGDLIFADASEDIAGVSRSVELCGISNYEAVSGLHTIATRFDQAILANGFKGFLQYIPSFSAHLRRLAAGTKVYAINRAHISSAEVRLPPVAEQKAIADVLMDMSNEIGVLRQRKSKIWSTKQGVMQQLLAGKIRLQ